MKQCRMDCIHIDACRRFADNSTYWNSGDCPIYKSAADVAPKSEVAREIFEEIDKKLDEARRKYRDLLDANGVIYTNYARAIVAELKKKYTEKNDGQK